MSNPATPPRRPAKRNTGLYPLSPNTPAASSSTSALSRSHSLTHHDPAIDRALQLSTFENNYSTEDFISTLSDKLIQESKSNPGPFDPKPFLQTFSPALDQLLSLRGQVAERTKKMETEVRRAEREYGRRLRELDGGFEAIGSSFSNLETKISEVSRSSVRTGEQLESLHQTRSTAQSTSLLLSYYLSIAQQTSTTQTATSSTTNPLEALFATRTSRDGRARLSVILRRLMSVAKDVADNAASAVTEAEAAAAKDTNGNADEGTPVLVKLIVKKRAEREKADRVRDEVERYCEKFEKEVLRLFDRSYRKGDPRMMAHCAKTLQDFNGGASCVQIYVNQHDFFISKDRVLEEAENAMKSPVEGGDVPADIWKTIGDPDSPAPKSEPGMAALFKEIRTTVSQEAQIVKAVFPDPAAVLQVFLQRVFAQVILQHLESLVSRATSISTLAVLRILNLTHSLCSSLIEDLKTYDATLSTAGSSKGPTTPGTGPLGAMLDHAMEEMFVPWLEGTRYLESENKNLVELYAGLLSRFTRYHETVLKAKPNSLLNKVVHQLSSSSTTASSSSTAQTAAAAISKYANLFTSGSTASSGTKGTSSPIVASKSNPFTRPGADGGASGAMTPVGRPGGQGGAQGVRGDLVDKSIEDKVWETDGLLTLQTVERMLKWHAEAVGRVVELSPASDVGKNAFALSKTLAEAIGRSFIETALDSALAKFENHDAKLEPDLRPIGALKAADQICLLSQRYASTAILPLAGNNAALRREMASHNSLNIVRMEGKINALIQRAIDSITAWLGQLLGKQKKNDYRPKDEEMSFARNNTEPCTLSYEFLETVRDSTREGLSGKNAEVFLTEVGVSFHTLLLDHYKRFPVNPTGGLMLTKDLASYQDIISTFSIPLLNDRFEMLRQLGNSFIVQPNVLKSYMTESHLGRIDARLLRPYLAQRSDYSTFSRSLQLEDGTGDEVIVDKSALSDFKGGAGSRLSAMSGVAGAGMGKLKEMLKEFDALSPEEEAEARRREKVFAEKRKQLGAQGYSPVPMYFAMGH